MERGKGKEGFVDRCNRTVRRETRETKAEIILRGTYDKPWIPVVVTYLPWHALAGGGFHVIMAGFNVQAAHVACYIIKKRNVCANWQATKAPLVTHRALQTDRAIHPSLARGEKMFKQSVKCRSKILANTTHPNIFIVG